MAQSIKPMPSFDFSKYERSRNADHISTTLRHCAALLSKGRAGLSTFELQDASCAIDDAIFLATDQHACEYPFLAKCYLYKGHVMWAMRRYVDACDAYKIASTVPTHNSIDRTASEEAAGLADKMGEKVRIEKRRGVIWSNSDQIARCHPSQGDSRFERHLRRLKMVGFRYDCPTIQQVQVKKIPCIQNAQLHNLRSPQKAEHCGFWMGAAPEMQLRRSVRRIAPDQYSQFAKDRPTIRIVQ
ncbi:hypothetical protein F5Y04DRAFT_281559 [Hypomontagnella monticulosa]|nr:hypothetical protein F5Y04DRAFT_281559 [Hypomontagnella monticulosa]